MDSVGRILYDARVAQGITLLDAEKATSIRASYLDALEQDDYAKMPEEVFIKGIIRNYGNFLGLNGPELVDMYKAQKVGADIENVKSKGIREVDTVKMNISLKQHRSAGSGVDAYQGPNSKARVYARLDIKSEFKLTSEVDLCRRDDSAEIADARFALGYLRDVLESGDRLIGVA